MTTTQQILAFFDGAIAYHQERVNRFTKARAAFVDGDPELVVLVPPPKRAARGSHLETIRNYLSGSLSRGKTIEILSLELNIPRSSVSTVLHKHNRTFVFDKASKRWSLRNLTPSDK